MNNSKTAIAVWQIRQKICSLVGWTLALFFGLGGVAASLPGSSGGRLDVSMLLFALPFAAFGVFLIVRGAKMKKLTKTFRQYVSLLAGDPTNSLENLARATNTDLSAVKANLRRMIDKRFFANAHIDEAAGRLILRDTGDLEQIARNGQQRARRQETVAVECPGCGAVSAVPKGTTAACEYCGTPLQG